MEATNTCGESGPQEYCIQTGYSNRKSCENTCNQDDHSPIYLTDLHEPTKQTWWQSETMFEGIQHPSQVNLTLHLGNTHTHTHQSKLSISIHRTILLRVNSFSGVMKSQTLNKFYRVFLLWSIWSGSSWYKLAGSGDQHLLNLFDKRIKINFHWIRFNFIQN